MLIFIHGISRVKIGATKHAKIPHHFFFFILFPFYFNFFIFFLKKQKKKKKNFVLVYINARINCKSDKKLSFCFSESLHKLGIIRPFTHNMKSNDLSSSSSPPTSCFNHFWSSALRAKPLAPPSSETSVRTNSGQGLIRRLSLFDLILLGIGASIGAGIFVVTGTVARDAGPGEFKSNHHTVLWFTQFRSFLLFFDLLWFNLLFLLYWRIILENRGEFPCFD